MDIKYDAEFDKETILKNLDRIVNQIFKLLPSREEGEDWETPLQNLIIEIIGMDRIILNQSITFSLVCKMESLLTLKEEKDFFTFRKVIFECLNLVNELKNVFR